MKINSILSTSYLTNSKLPAQQQNPIASTEYSAMPAFAQAGFYLSNVSFKKAELTDEDYQRAKKYIENIETLRLKEMEKFKCPEEWKKHYKLSTEKLDFEKLNGIQKGLKTFEGMSMKEVAFVVHNFKSILVSRGCVNQCAHCLAGAEPSQKYKFDERYITKMSWEDFTTTMQDFGELHRRLGPKVDMQAPESSTHLLFYDSDCINIETEDKQGNKYDYVDMDKVIERNIDSYALFDTSGWPPNDKKLQERAEKIVKYFMRERDESGNTVNISINPFHMLNVQSLRYKKDGNLEKAEELKNKYTDRIANALFTFTPLIIKRYITVGMGTNFGLIVRAYSIGNEFPEGYRTSDLTELKEDIMEKLKKLYYDDLKSGNSKVIHNEYLAQECLKILQDKIDRIDCKIAKCTRTDELFKSQNLPTYNNCGVWIDKSDETSIRRNLTEKQNGAVIIDADGQIYYGKSADIIIPTELQLNFENKNKMTPPIHSKPFESAISKEMIEKAFTNDE